MSVKNSRDAGKQVQDVLAKIESMPNPAAKALMHDCLASLLEFYGNGLGRIIELLRETAPSPDETLSRLARDPAISGLLLIHGLHPLDLETRLRQALDKVRPYMESHGGNVELLSLEQDFARLRLHGACKTCPASSVTLELAVRQAVEEACPDLTGFEVEGVEGRTATSPVSDQLASAHD